MSLHDIMRELERSVLLETLAMFEYNESRTARYLKIHRNTLRNKLRNCSIDAHQLRRHRKNSERILEIIHARNPTNNRPLG